MSLLEFKFKVGGTLVNPTSVVLSDPTGTYGVKRDDTDVKVVNDGVPMDQLQPPVTGIFRYELGSPIPGVSYTWYAEVIYKGATYHFPRTFRAGVTLPVCPYFSWDQFVNRWGAENIRVASNKDNKSTTPNYDAIQDAFDFAVDEMATVMAGGLYAIPLDFSVNEDVVPRRVREWMMVIAFESLYNGRGLEDKNRVGNKITKQLGDVYIQMSLAKAGLTQLPALTAVDSAGNAVSVSPNGINVGSGVGGVGPWYRIDGCLILSGICYG